MHENSFNPDSLNDGKFIFKNYYTFKSFLGKGSFGLVVEAMNKENCENIAVKVK